MKKNWSLLEWRPSFSPKPNLEPTSIEIARSLFDAEWYEQTYLNSREGAEDSWVHFLKLGSKRGYDPNSMFDTDWYLAQYPEIAATNENPLLHYVRIGANEGKDPNPFFSSTYYLSKNPDIKSLGVNPLQHFREFGCDEGRIPYSNSWPKEITPWKNEFEIAESNTAVSSRKKIAIVIPVFNNWFATERCLRAIQSTDDIHLADIVVVNDGSTDNTLSQLERFLTIRVINTPVNIGFTRACNFAFEKLQDYDLIYLLNNDTEVLNGFLSNSLSLMKTHPNAALVGSTLHFPNGTLQECGAIVWSDGTAHNFGRGRSLGPIDFRFSRRVDYCSGAGMLIRNDLLNEVGFFDDRYSPAYYEDTDLSFKLRARGYEIWVCTSSRVIHHEGLSHGADTDLLVSINREKFCSKWDTELLNHNENTDDPELVLKAAMRQNKYSDSEIISDLIKLLWISRNQI